MAADTRGSVGSFSEDYAQSREATELWEPSDEVFAREGAALRARMEEAAGCLERARADRSVSPARLAALEAEYEATAEAWMEWQGALKEDLLVRPGYLSMASALRVDLETGEELSSVDEHARRQALEVLIDYVMQSGLADLGGAFKNFLAMVRRIKPEAMEGISQSDLALIFGECRATTQAREKARIEMVARRMGVGGWLFLGGTKPVETRRRSAEAARGNTNRRDGSRRKRL